nr:MAG TPA: hypothetical protein [Caudoviricetes sp.]
MLLSLLNYSTPIDILQQLVYNKIKFNKKGAKKKYGVLPCYYCTDF